MTSPLSEAADRLGTDRLSVTVGNAWSVATPEASITDTPPDIVIEPAPAPPPDSATYLVNLLRAALSAAAELEPTLRPLIYPTLKSRGPSPAARPNTPSISPPGESTRSER